MLRSIYIDRYKSFVDCTIDLTGPITLLSGPNGSGKSSIFEVLGKLSDLVGRGAPLVSESQPNGLDFLGKTFTRWMSSMPERQTQRFALCVEGNEGRYDYSLTLCNRPSSLYPRIEQEEVLFNGNPLYRYKDSNVHLFDNTTYVEKVTFGSDWSRSFIPSVMERPENTKLIWFRKWISDITVLHPNPWEMREVADGEVSRISADASDFAAWYRFLIQDTDERSYKAYVDNIRASLPELTRLRLQSAGPNMKMLRLSFQDENGKESEYALTELSDGQRLLLVLYATLFYAQKDCLLCFDEPDNFLDLSEIQTFINTLLYEDLPCQIILSSHHPFFYDDIPEENLLVLKRTENSAFSSTHILTASEAFSTSPLSRSEIVARGWEGMQ